MEICDRCFNRGEYRPSTKKITSSDHQAFALCESCFVKHTSFMENKDLDIAALRIKFEKEYYGEKKASSKNPVPTKKK